MNEIVTASESRTVTAHEIFNNNNLNTGTAKIKVFGTKKYVGSIETTFEIGKKDINKCKITVKNTNLKYTGYDQKKNISVTVKDGSNVLVENVDYKINYTGDWKAITNKKDKENIPTIQIIAADKGNYTDGTAKKKLTKAFKITKASLSSKVSITTALMVDGKECEKDANGVYTVPADKTPEVVAKCSGVTLKGMAYVKGADTSGKDYTIKEKTSKKKGITTKTLTLTGVNNFSGKQTIKYTVK